MPFQSKLLAALFAIGAMLGIAVLSSSMLCFAIASEESVDVALKENANVGVGFNLLSNETTTLLVKLKSPAGKTIETSSYHEATGTLLWNPDAESGEEHIWEGKGLTINSGHAVRFEATLGSQSEGEGEGGPNISHAAIADLDIDADTSVPPLHTGGDNGNWPPSGSIAEDQAEAATSGGLALPPGLVASFPNPDVLDQMKPFKILKLKFNTRWNGPAGEFGEITLAAPINGIRLYKLSDNSRVTSTTKIPISSNTYEEQFGILSDTSFGTAGFITATFTWNSTIQGGNPNAVDTIRIYPASAVTVVEIPDEIEGPLYAIAGNPLHLKAKLDNEATWPAGLPNWSIVSKPAGSNVADPPDGNDEITFTPDIKGQYVIKAAGGQSDTIQIIVTEVIIKTRPTLAGSWDSVATTTQIGTGGFDDNGHKADVEISFDPALPASTVVNVYLSGGEGFDPTIWWWYEESQKRATLVMSGEGGTYIAGETSEQLSFNSPTLLAGKLTSSRYRPADSVNDSNAVML